MGPERAPLAERRFVSLSTEATEALGEALGRLLGPGAVLALAGEMGSGKTAFVRGLARGLGVEGEIASPSFTLLREHPGRLPLLHFDAWMEGRERAFLLDGGSELLGRGGVAAIEWGERVADLLPGPHLVLELAHAGADRRRIRIALEGAGAAGPSAPLAAALAALVPPPGVEEPAAGGG
jgi:tRNA threonylcarbamoyladenosine biosynthesis protein TsaE